MTEFDFNDIAALLDVVHKASTAGAKYAPLAAEADFQLQAFIADARDNAAERAKAKTIEDAKLAAEEAERQQALADEQAQTLKAELPTKPTEPIEVDAHGKVVPTNGRRV